MSSCLLQATVIADSRFFQLVYCNTCDQDVTNRGVVRMSFAPDGVGKERKDKVWQTCFCGFVVFFFDITVSQPRFKL